MRRDDIRPHLNDSEKVELEKLQLLNHELTLLFKDSLQHDINFSPESALLCTSKILLSNPDVLTAWRVRRYALIFNFKYRNIGHDLEYERDMSSAHPIGDQVEIGNVEGFEKNNLSGDIVDKYGALKKELEFSVAAIKLNCKSYGAWYHRKWLAQVMGETLDLDAEFKLCAKLLALDSRNFHCWNYRIYLFEVFGLYKDVEAVQREFDFTTLMIYKDFSNYSAWHRRSVIFPLLDKNRWVQQISHDLKLVRSAYFTEPYDQSCWFYLRWLFGKHIPEMEQHLKVEQHSKSENDHVINMSVDSLLCDEIKSIKELIEQEPNCSLAICTLKALGVDFKVPVAAGDYDLRKGMYLEK